MFLDLIQMTIGQRLNVMNMGATKGSQVGKSPPSVNALTKLLTQGLQSKDKKIINVSYQASTINILHIEVLCNV